MTTYLEAIDDTFKLIDDEMIAVGPAIVGYVPDRFWQNVEKPELQDAERYWINSIFQLNIEGQDALSVGNSGERLYRSQGLVFIAVYGPKIDPEAILKVQNLAIALRDRFRLTARSANGVLYRNAQINTLPPESEWIKLQIMLEFDYEEVR